MWAQQHHQDVLVLQPQTPLPGTPDYDWDQAQKQAAITEKGPAEPRPACFFNEAARTGKEQQGSAVPSHDAEDCQPNHEDRVLSNPKLLDHWQSLERGGQLAATVQLNGKPFTCNPDNWKPFQLAWMRESNVADAIKWGQNGGATI
ncbi:hypothetical protein COCOBI_19-1880 [Coccomyxa sp. Obi]|nr:hypothetical protein COCOBI_19-1880 [Coccomyxa sp. Obi]